MIAVMLFIPNNMVFATALPFIVDNAEIFEESAEKGALKPITEIRETYGIDVLVLSVDDFGETNPSTYMQTYYQDNSYNENGISIGISVAENTIVITTHGTCSENFTEQELESMHSYIKDDADPDDYDTIMIDFVLLVENKMKVLDQATYEKKLEAESAEVDTIITTTTSPNGQSEYTGDEKIKMFFGWMIGALFIAIISTSIMVMGMSNVKQQDSARNYLINSKVTRSSDNFLRKNVKKQKKPAPKEED